jgi:hypothetical protein
MKRRTRNAIRLARYLAAAQAVRAVAARIEAAYMLGVYPCL